MSAIGQERRCFIALSSRNACDLDGLDIPGFHGEFEPATVIEDEPFGHTIDLLDLHRGTIDVLDIRQTHAWARARRRAKTTAGREQAPNALLIKFDGEAGVRKAGGKVIGGRADAASFRLSKDPQHRRFRLPQPDATDAQLVSRVGQRPQCSLHKQDGKFHLSLPRRPVSASGRKRTLTPVRRDPHDGPISPTACAAAA